VGSVLSMVVFAILSCSKLGTNDQWSLTIGKTHFHFELGYAAFRKPVKGISAQVAKRSDSEQDNLDHYEEYKKVSKPFRQEPILLKTKPYFWKTFFGATCVAYFC